ncbi:hypothetical protein Dsin_016696 [Dipteronia sinensis]|uniref:RING-type E3 ubiquitin transferase n=1 Tax=Dipteronia sinensis TaxID=43782 RepID=A0AAE0AF07_9ROSI|nr:hypothetical protein Dsin_016696 [Dipteronia sinensis]
MLEEGIMCCFCGAWFYLIKAINESNLGFLSKATRVDTLQDLSQLLEKQSTLPLVARSGKIGSDTPITLKNSSELALEFLMTVGSQVFQRFKLPKEIKEADIEMLEVQETERLVRIGTPLNVVGEAVKDVDGTIVILSPHERSDLYLSQTNTYYEISELQKGSNFFKYASVVLTVIGVCLIASSVIERILQGNNSQRRVAVNYGNKLGQAVEDSNGGLHVIYLEKKSNPRVVFKILGPVWWIGYGTRKDFIIRKAKLDRC